MPKGERKGLKLLSHHRSASDSAKSIFIGSFPGVAWGRVVFVIPSFLQSRSNVIYIFISLVEVIRVSMSKIFSKIS